MCTACHPDLVLTPVQIETLQAIDALTARHGYPPTYRELAAYRGLRSTNGVCCTCAQLRALGVLAPSVRGASRTIRRAAT